MGVSSYVTSLRNIATIGDVLFIPFSTPAYYLDLSTKSFATFFSLSAASVTTYSTSLLIRLGYGYVFCSSQRTAHFDSSVRFMLLVLKLALSSCDGSHGWYYSLPSLVFLKIVFLSCSTSIFSSRCVSSKSCRKLID